MKTKTTTIKLGEELHTRLRGLAAGKQRTSHWVMREAIAEYVEREEKRLRFYEAARKSWEDYQETGRFVERNKALEWLESWGTESEKPAPVCKSGR